MTKTYIGTKIVTAWPQIETTAGPGDPATTRGGYTVRYEDGYTSWSPKDVFEAAYVEVPEAEAAERLAELRAVLSGKALTHPQQECSELVREHRGRALQMAHEANPQGNTDTTLVRARQYARFIVDGEEGVKDGPITRAEINRRGFDGEEGAEQTMLGIMAKLGFPTTENPMGTDPTHELVPIRPPATNYAD
jgi:hypothetical protein